MKKNIKSKSSTIRTAIITFFSFFSWRAKQKTPSVINSDIPAAKFFMPQVQLKRENIHKVLVLEAVKPFDFDEANDTVILPRVVINNNHVFEGQDGLKAIEQLKATAFYSLEEYTAVKEYFNTLLMPLNSALTTVAA